MSGRGKAVGEMGTERGIGKRRGLAACKDIPYAFAMILSRISSKAQTTIPKAVRAALGLRRGDEIAYEIDGDRVILTRAKEPDGFVANFSTFSEWASEADGAYDELEWRFPRNPQPE